MRKLSSLVMVLILAIVLSATASAIDIYPLEDVTPGLLGIGKTVVQGRLIEEFDVEVLGIIPQVPPTPSLIMVRVSGDVIDRTGGIASGMSGSPVYIDGALLGAIGYGYSYTDHRVGLVTPAEAMFGIVDQLPEGECILPVELPADMTPINTPLVVTGIGGRALEFLRGKLSPLDFAAVPGHAQSSQTEEVYPIEPGSALGVQLMRGDFQVGAFGTVTHVMEDGKFIGFGHPFRHSGDVEYFASDAYVHYTMPNLEMPQKIMSFESEIGAVFQDRAAGVGGLVGETPDYVPVTIGVSDQDRQREREYYLEVVADQSLFSTLVITGAYQGIDGTLDRIGQGTSYVRLEFASPDLSQPMIRENLFFSDSDIAVWSLTDLQEGIELLRNNNLQEIDLSSVNISVEIEQERKTATIEKAVPRLFTVVPGDSLEVEVTIRPYRSTPETRILRLEIPADTAPGLMTVTVRSGGSGYYVTKPPVHTTFSTVIDDDDDVSHRVATGAESLDALIQEYVDREKNNEIVAEFYPFIDTFGSPQDKGEDEDLDEENEQAIPAFHWDDAGNEAQRVRLATQYVIEGMATFDIEVAAQ